ncbi:MAG TPA: alpha/beta fold hydrolase [Microlunatus sp.]
MVGGQPGRAGSRRRGGPSHPARAGDSRPYDLGDRLRQLLVTPGDRPGVDGLVRIDALPVKPIVVGHSFGGLIAQELLADGYATAAVAIDPAPSTPTKGSADRRRWCRAPRTTPSPAR